MHGFHREPDSGHAARAACLALGAAAGNDHPDGHVEIERATGPGRSHFAHTMARHCQRLDALRFQQAGDGHLNGKQQGLGNDGIVEAGGFPVGLQLGQQRKAGDGLHAGVELGQDVGKGRRFVHEAQAHAHPLRAVARIDEGHATRVRQLFFEHQTVRSVVLGVHSQFFRRLVRCLGIECQALFQAVASVRGGVSDIVVIRGRAVPQPFRIAAGQGSQRRVRTRGEEKRRQDLWDKRSFLLPAIFAQQDVRVGAAKTERVDAGHQRGLLVQRPIFGDWQQIEPDEIDVRIRCFEVELRRQCAMLQCQDRLHQTRHAGGGLHVAKIGLDRADG